MLLLDLMEKFFQPETFKQEALYECEKCSSPPTNPDELADTFFSSLSISTHRLRRAEKWYSIKSLPQILVLHIKRFSPAGHGRFVKSTEKVLFPETLDMSLYCEGHSLSSTSEKDSRSQMHSPITEPFSSDSDSLSDLSVNSDPLNFSHSSQQLYQLYSTVVHIGSSMEAGHYVSNVKMTSDSNTSLWYLCSDSSISQVSSPSNSGETYILFYRRVCHSFPE